MYSEILLQLRTISDVDTLKEEIDILLNSLYKSNFEETLYSKVRKTIVDSLVRVGAIHESPLRSLQKQLSDLRVLKLTLALEPTPALVDNISSWVKTNVGEDVVLDLDLNSDLIGGAQIAFAGKYADYSLSSAYDQFCQTAK